MLLPAYDVHLLMWNTPATSALTRGVGNRLVNLVRTSVNTEPLAILKQRTIMTTSVAAVAPASADSLTGVKRKATTRVGTHNGTFHCDEVLGCFMIRLTDRYSEAEIVRTRDQTVRCCSNIYCCKHCTSCTKSHGGQRRGVIQIWMASIRVQ